MAVRADLPTGLQMAQAIHAAFGFAHRYSGITDTWLRDSQFLVVVQVPDEQALMDLTYAADDKQIDLHLWREPDCHDQATAVAFAPVPATMRLCSSLPLAGRVMA